MVAIPACGVLAFMAFNRQCVFGGEKVPKKISAALAVGCRRRKSLRHSQFNPLN
jgi:hypothetical protein